MTKKRRPQYPQSRKSKGPAPVYAQQATPPTVASINGRALTGRADIAVGMRVVIGSSGLYAGETAVVESIASGVIPAANVRTEAGRTRRVRTIDLVPAPAAQAPAAPSPAAPSPAEDARER
jgi:hypothetical protein